MTPATGLCVWVQVRSQLQQELSLKQEAFVQVERLQGRLSDMEEALSRSTSTTTGSHTPALVDVVHIHTLVRQVLNYKEPLIANLVCFRFLRTEQVLPHVVSQQAEQQKSLSRYLHSHLS